MNIIIFLYSKRNERIGFTTWVHFFFFFCFVAVTGYQAGYYSVFTKRLIYVRIRLVTFRR